jgi:hypothetical protein
LLLTALILPAWSIGTFYAMRGRTINSWKFIICFGLLVEGLYIGVLKVKTLDPRALYALFAL